MTERFERFDITNDARALLNDLGLELAGKEQCTCHALNAPNYGAHSVDCDLVYNPDFEMGYAYWDYQLKALVELPDDARDVLNGDDSVSPRQLLLDLAEEIAELRAGDKGRVFKDERDDFDVLDPWPYKGSDKWSKQAWGDLCDHVQSRFVLPTGEEIYASGLHNRRAGEVKPDFGVYLDGGWRPDCLAYHIGCPDRGTPLISPAQVIEIAREVIRRAKSGERVEVGCVGGHGRTGLMLGAITLTAVVDSGGKMTGPAAVSYVRTMHCQNAVESREQEWWVDCVAHELRGEQWPARPKIAPAPKATVKPGDSCPACNHWTVGCPCRAMVKRVENEISKWVNCNCQHDWHNPQLTKITGKSQTGGNMVYKDGEWHPVKTGAQSRNGQTRKNNRGNGKNRGGRSNKARGGHR